MTRLENKIKQMRDVEKMSFIAIGKALGFSDTKAGYIYKHGERNPRGKAKVKGEKRGNVDLVSKGHVKLQKNENKFKTLKRNPSDYRSVSMFDSKNTIKQVRKDDPRSDEQIRSDWKVEQERKLKSLRD